MKNLFILFFVFGVSLGLQAQTDSEVIIIKKTITYDNGNVEVEKYRFTDGEKADALLAKIKEERIEGAQVELDVEKVVGSQVSKMVEIEAESDDEEEIEVVVNMENAGSNRISITREEGGEVAVFEWEGDGEMPAEIKEELEKEGVNVFIEDKNDKKVIIKKTDTIEKSLEEDEGAEVFEWTDDGKLPDDVRKELEERGIDIEEILEEGGDGTRKIFIKTHKEDQTPENKAMLGVYISDRHEQGIEITDFVGGTKAEQSGLKRGDVITAIVETQVNELAELMEALAPYKPGDKVYITYLRDGEKGYATVEMSEKKKVTGYQFMDVEVETESIHEHDNGEHEIKILKKKKNN